MNENSHWYAYMNMWTVVVAPTIAGILIALTVFGMTAGWTYVQPYEKERINGQECIVWLRDVPRHVECPVR